MAVNMFAKAKSAPAPVKPVAAAERESFKVSGLEELTVIDTLIKNLDALKKSMRSGIDAQLRAKFIEGEENFDAYEGIAEAVALASKRSTNSQLTAEEVEALEADDIPVGKMELVPERFVVNPAYADDQKLLKRVSDALGTVKGMPEDFIMKQDGTEKRVVTDETLKAIKADAELLRKHFDTVSVIGLKPKLTQEMGIPALLEKLKSILAPKKVN
jgi:hypothetical protein